MGKMRFILYYQKDSAMYFDRIYEVTNDEDTMMMEIAYNDFYDRKRPYKVSIAKLDSANNIIDPDVAMNFTGYLTTPEVKNRFREMMEWSWRRERWRFEDAVAMGR